MVKIYSLCGVIPLHSLSNGALDKSSSGLALLFSVCLNASTFTLWDAKTYFICFFFLPF